MAACKCCPQPGWSEIDLLRYVAIPAPFVPPAPLRGSTYVPLTVEEVAPQNPAVPGVLLFDKNVVYWWLTLLRASYHEDNSLADRALQALDVYDTATFRGNDSSLTPGWFGARFSTGTVIVISGTSNSRQAVNYIIAHAGTFSAGPSWQVNSAWYTAATALLPSITPLLPPAGQPVVIIGHSYGGPIAAVLMALLPGTKTPQTHGLVTAGSPAFGNTTFCPALANVAQMRIVNVGDPVTFMPPPALVGYAPGGGLPPFRLNVGTYEHCVPPVWLAENGRYAGGAAELLDAAFWFPQVAAWLQGDPLSVEPHFAREYVRRAALVASPIPGPFLAGWADFSSLKAVNDALAASGI